MNNTMTASQAKAKLDMYGISFDTVSLRKGVYTARKEFFYCHGDSGHRRAETIKNSGAAAWFKVLDSGTEFKPFRGGAGVVHNSHFWVKFELIPLPAFTA